MNHYFLIRDAVDKTRQDYNRGSLTVIVEDDFLARVYYHLLSSDFEGLSAKAFIKTRILQDNGRLPKNNKYDLVIGESRIIKLGSRPTKDVKPNLVAEFKVFPVGFSPQQLSKRRKHISDDIEKLAVVASETKGQKPQLVIVFFDEICWLRGRNRDSVHTRIDEIKDKRDQLNEDIRIIGILEGQLVEE